MVKISDNLKSEIDLVFAEFKKVGLITDEDFNDVQKDTIKVLNDIKKEVKPFIIEQIKDSFLETFRDNRLLFILAGVFTVGVLFTSLKLRIK